MRHQQGVTLVELIVAIVLLSIVLTGAVSLFNAMAINQARNMQTYQGIQVADYFLNEVTSMSFEGAASLNRNKYSNVDNYNNLSNNGCLDQFNGDTPCNRRGVPVDAWRDYSVAISVLPVTVSGQEMKQVSVTVTSPLGDNVKLTGFKGKI